MFQRINHYWRLFATELSFRLDSIDALELGLAIRKKYNVRIDAEKDDVVKIFASVATLAEFIESERHFRTV